MHNAYVSNLDHDEIVHASNRMVEMANRSRLEFHVLGPRELHLDHIRSFFLSDSPDKSLAFRHSDWPEGQYIQYNKRARSFEFVQIVTPGKRSLEALDFDVQKYYGWFEYRRTPMQWLMYHLTKRGF